MAGLRVGQAYGSVPPTWVWVVGVSPRSLSTQPPFATQALTLYSMNVPNGFFGIRDLAYFKAGIRDFEGNGVRAPVAQLRWISTVA